MANKIKTVSIAMTSEIEDALIQRNLTEMYVYNLAEVKRLRDRDDLEIFRDDYNSSMELIDGVRKVMRHCLGDDAYDQWIEEHGTEDDSEKVEVHITENDDGTSTVTLSASNTIVQKLAQIGFLKSLGDHIERTLAEMEGRHE